MDNITIFGLMYEDYKITKPIRLIEFFAGYGSQALALKYLGVPFEHWKICEWAVPSIQAYKDAHFTDNNRDYSENLTIEEIINYLFNKGISMDYNQPMKKEQIKRLKEEQLRTIYNNIITTNNLVNIQQVHGKDLEIVNKDEYDYIFTYSFPCQDLSLVGKGKGMSKGSGTRSGMLWEVERILDECNQLGTLPQILLMENVPQIIGEKNIKDFQSWREKLESLGYSNYIEVLNAKYYGVPQNRERAFMISILGEYNYNFPVGKKLNKRLKHILEKKVDKKYYLTNNMIKCILRRTPIGDKPNFANNLIGKEANKIAGTITCKSGSRGSDNYIIENMTQKQIDELIFQKKVIEIVPFGTYYTWADSQGNLSTQCNRASDINDLAPTIPTINGLTKIINLNKMEMRKLTPKECFRLMGVKDEDFENIAKNQSNSKLYHLAGDSIVVNVLMGIFKEMMA